MVSFNLAGIKPTNVVMIYVLCQVKAKGSSFRNPILS